MKTHIDSSAAPSRAIARLSAVIAMMMAVFELFTLQAHALSFLKTNGTSICENYGNGNPVHLHGTNAGGWLVQESWMNNWSTANGVDDHKSLLEALESRFGASGRDELIGAHEDHYWTTQDFDNCAAMGMNVLRLPFTYMNLVDSNRNLKSDAFSRIDWFVSQCAQRNIYVILDLHGAFGSQNGMDHSGEINDGNQLYNNPQNRADTLALWVAIADRYKNNPAVAGYDILNEPGIKGGLTTSLQWDFYDDIYDAIRGVDQDHIIFIQSCWNVSDLPDPAVYGWNNVVYSYHVYPWGNDQNYQGQMSHFNGFINDVNNSGFGVPTYVGEFTCFDNMSAWSDVIAAFNANDIHYTSWSYKTKHQSSWGIYNYPADAVNLLTESYENILNKWSKTTSEGWVYQNLHDVMQAGFAGGGGGIPGGDSLDNGQYFLVAIANDKVVCAEDGGESIVAATRDSSEGAWETFELVNNSDGSVSFRSVANNQYLTAVLDEQNQIIPRSSSIGDWEKFQIEPIPTGGYSIKSLASGKYIKSDLEQDARLFATSDSVSGAWEAFEILTVGTPFNSNTDPWNNSLVANGEYYLTSIANSRVVSAEDGGSSPLKASQGDIGGAWEAFVLNNNSDGTVSLQSLANNKYVQADLNDNSILVASGDAIGTWEKFTLELTPDNRYALKSVANDRYVKADLDQSGVLYASSDGVEGAWEAFAITPSNEDDGIGAELVEVFIHGGYQGGAASLDVGDYNMNDLASRGIPNDTISSLRVPNGYRVTLYNDINFGGAILVCTTDASSIGAFNDLTTSLKVESNQGEGGQLFPEGEYYLTSLANNRVVSAENGGNDPLKASQGNIGGAWEAFVLMNNSDGTVSFQSQANNQFVQANLNGNNIVVPDGSTIGTWEKFVIEVVAEDQYALKSVANGKYVKADLDQDGTLYAGSDNIEGAWEVFAITPTGEDDGIEPVLVEIYADAGFQGSSASLEVGDYNMNDLAARGIPNDAISSLRVPDGYRVTLYNDIDYRGGLAVYFEDASSIGFFNDKATSLKVEVDQGRVFDEGDYYLRSRANGKVVCAENGGSSPLVADRDNCGGAWETFVIVNNSDGTVCLRSKANNQYVATDLNQDKKLFAHAGDTNGSWQRFYIERAGNGEFALKAVANNKYVLTLANGNKLLYSDAGSIGGSWELYEVCKP